MYVWDGYVNSLLQYLAVFYSNINNSSSNRSNIKCYSNRLQTVLSESLYVVVTDGCLVLTLSSHDGARSYTDNNSGIAIPSVRLPSCLSDATRYCVEASRHPRPAML